MSNPFEQERNLIWKAGIFVGIGLLLAGFVVFLLGQERGMFSDKISYRTAFMSVDGLQLDSPVRLGGLTVGRVKRIEFSDDLNDVRILVEIEVQKIYSERIREDSVVRITSRGVLGDKAIEINVGSADKPVAKRNAFLEANDAGDVLAFINRAGEIVENVIDITRSVKDGVGVYADPKFAKNVAETVEYLRAVFSGIQSGPGILHTLVFDKRFEESTQALLQSLSLSAAKLDKALSGADALISEVHAAVNQGDGLVGAAFQSLGEVASELALLVKAARENSEGAIHRLFYGESAQLINDLASSTEDLKAIMGKVRSGEGSLGAIINDPTVYEDLKEILGNIKRNRMLRGLVRLSISNEDFEHIGKATPDKTAPDKK